VPLSDLEDIALKKASGKFGIADAKWTVR